MIPANGLVAPSGYAITNTKSAASSIDANIFRPVTRYPPLCRRARAFSGRSPISDVVIGSEKLPAISLRSCTTSSAMRRLASIDTSALCNSGMTTEACMLKASAVDGQPWPSASYAIV